MGQSRPFTRFVLVVEDDPAVRALAAAMFEETDLYVLEAETAEEALSYMQRHGRAVAFLLVDVTLPGGLDGVTLARMVAKIWPETRNIVTSGRHPDVPLPKGMRFMPRPWRALEIIIEAARASSELPSV